MTNHEIIEKALGINGKPQIDKTNHLAEAYEFGKRIYERSDLKFVRMGI